MKPIQAEAQKPRLWVLMLLAAAVVMSAISVSWSVCHARQLTSHVQNLQAQQKHLNVRWGRLQLEKSTWGAYMRVQKIAHDKLHMIQPDSAKRVVVLP